MANFIRLAYNLEVWKLIEVHKTTKKAISAHKLCGSGRFSNVYCGQMISPIEKEVAVKNVWSDTETRHLATSEYPEIQILSKLFHPAISNLLYFYSRNANDKVWKLERKIRNLKNWILFR